MDSERGLSESVPKCVELSAAPNASSTRKSTNTITTRTSAPVASPTTTTSVSTVAPPPSPTFSYASFAEGFDQRFERTTISEWCSQPSSCEYRCSRACRVSSSRGVVTFKPSFSIDGCDCLLLTGSAVGPTTALIDRIGMRVQYDTRINNTMTASQSGCVMQYMPGEPVNPFEAKSYVRDSVAPAECTVRESCYYMCSTGYSIDFVGDDKVRATPAVAISSPSCSCYPVFATIHDNGTAAGSDGSISYRLARTPSGITVDLTVSGMTCRGTYSPGTYVENKSSSASAVQTMLWATVVASVLAFAASSFGVAT